jgi:hypothetical protein
MKRRTELLAMLGAIPELGFLKRRSACPEDVSCVGRVLPEGIAVTVIDPPNWGPYGEVLRRKNHFLDALYAAVAAGHFVMSEAAKPKPSRGTDKWWSRRERQRRAG